MDWKTVESVWAPVSKIDQLSPSFHGDELLKGGALGIRQNARVQYSDGCG